MCVCVRAWPGASLIVNQIDVNQMPCNNYTLFVLSDLHSSPKSRLMYCSNGSSYSCLSLAVISKQHHCVYKAFNFPYQITAFLDIFPSPLLVFWTAVRISQPNVLFKHTAVFLQLWKCAHSCYNTVEIRNCDISPTAKVELGGCLYNGTKNGRKLA